MHWLHEASHLQELHSARLRKHISAPDPVQAYIDSRLGNAYRQRGDIKRAMELFGRALRVQSKMLHPTHTELVGTRLSLASAHRDLGDTTKAAEAAEAVEKTLRSGSGEGPDLGRALLLKADLLREAGRLKEAQNAVDEALRRHEAAFGTEHPEVGVAFNVRGSVLQDQGRLHEALGAYKKALNVNMATVGEQHAETAATHNSLGTLFQDAGDLEASQEHFLRCLRIQLQVLGEHSPEVANSYNNIATVSFKLGEKADAADMLRKALLVLDAAGVPQGNPDRAVYEENLQEVLASSEPIASFVAEA